MTWLCAPNSRRFAEQSRRLSRWTVRPASGRWATSATASAFLGHGASRRCTGAPGSLRARKGAEVGESMQRGFDSSFLRGKPWVATAKCVATRWNCGEPGQLFRCAWCGHKFVVGDVVRCVYTNSDGDETRGIGGNPFICQACDGPRDVILAKLRDQLAKFRDERFWWFRRRGR